MLQELSKYLLQVNNLTAFFGLALFISVAYNVRAKVKQMNGANIRLHKRLHSQEEEIKEIKYDIKALRKCVAKLKKIVYEISGRLHD